MKFPDRKLVEKVRKEYPAGCRVELVQMDDVQAPPIGTKGTVYAVDDAGDYGQLNIMESIINKCSKSRAFSQ